MGDRWEIDGRSQRDRSMATASRHRAPVSCPRLRDLLSAPSAQVPREVHFRAQSFSELYYVHMAALSMLTISVLLVGPKAATHSLFICTRAVHDGR